MFKYDDKGYLQPSEIIACTENQFRDEFIYKLDRESGFGVRGKRWNEYCDFIAFIKKMKPRESFKVWVFGSLIGNYKEPTDVDVILILKRNDCENFITSGVYEFIRKNCKFMFNVDCSHIFKEPENEEEKLNYEASKLDLALTCKDRKTRKGAIEIVY